MVKRWQLVLLTVVVLGSFAALLGGGQWLKQPQSPDEDIAVFLQRLEPVLLGEPEWETAMQLQAGIEHAWSRVEKRLQFSVEKDDMIEFTEELVRLKAAIEMQEQPVAWEAHALLKTVWNRMR